MGDRQLKFDIALGDSRAHVLCESRSVSLGTSGGLPQALTSTMQLANHSSSPGSSFYPEILIFNNPPPFLMLERGRLVLDVLERL